MKIEVVKAMNSAFLSHDDIFAVTFGNREVSPCGTAFIATNVSQLAPSLFQALYRLFQRNFVGVKLKCHSIDTSSMYLNLSQKRELEVKE